MAEEKRTGKHPILYRLSVKIILAVVAVVCGICTVATTIGAFVYHGLPSFEEELNTKYNSIARNYSADIIAHYQSGKQIDSSGRADGTNLRYVLIEAQTDEFDSLDLSDPSIYVVGSPEDAKNYKYSFHGSQLCYYVYNISNNWRTVIDSSYAYTEIATNKTVSKNITAYAYAKDTGRFFVCSDAGKYYPADSFMACYADEITEDAYKKAVDEEEETEQAGGASEEASAEPIEVVNGDAEYIRVGDKYYRCGTELWNWDGEHYISEQPQREYQYSYLQTTGCVELLGTKEGSLTIVSNPVDEFLSMHSDSSEKLEIVEQEKSLNRAEDSGILDLNNKSIQVYPDESEVMNYWVLSWVEEPLTVENDIFADCNRIWGSLYAIGKVSIYLQVVFLLLTFVSLVSFLVAVGHRPEDDEIHLRAIDRSPFLLYTAAAVIAECLIPIAIDALFEGALGISLVVILLGEGLLTMGLIAIAYLASFVVRCKAHCFWRYTCLHMLMTPIRKIAGDISKNTPLVWKTVLLIICGIVVETLGILFELDLIENDRAFLAIVIFLVVNVIIAYGILRIVLQIDRLRDHIKKMAEGDLQEPLSEQEMILTFKDMAQDLNRIEDGITAAVNKAMKSEHFRTELITNVSHDIKTPLTSIINYVDLIKREEITDPTLVEYIEVLDRQSARLKKLIEDLMEASKASTGNLKVELEEMDATVLLQQAAGEFAERLEKSQLNLVITAPETPVRVLADGRHLWRVFDNLLSNICKYSMPGTRVYATLEQNPADGTTITFRNISATQLNISSEELMERFVRGDTSRNTEGSGLGLSIAQSLMQLMGGSLSIEIDGDLFKAVCHLGTVL